MIPARLTRPTVGLVPTTPLAADGQTIDPSVSVPIATAVRFADTPTPDPELEPQGLRSSTYGFRHCPPRALHPLDDRVDLKFAHSLKLALPISSAPAFRSRRATSESIGGTQPFSASGCGHPITSVDVVLQQNGNTVQRSARTPILPVAIQLIGNGESIRIRFENGPQRRP